MAAPTLGSTTVDAGSTVRALVEHGGYLYVGGDFTTLQGVTLTRLARIDLATLTVDSSWNGNANQSVYAFALVGDMLYVGGSFTSIGGSSRGRLARFDLSGSTPSLDTWNGSATSSSVFCLHASGSYLYVGGGFTSLGGSSRARLGRFDISGTPSLDSFNGNCSGGNVLALAVSGSYLYVAGVCTNIGGSSRNRLGRFDISSTPTLDSWDGGANSYLQRAVVHGDYLYVGGEFTTLNGGTSCPNVGRFDISSTPTLDGWDAGCDFRVEDLYVDDTNDQLLVCGAGFFTLGGEARRGVGSFDVTSSTPALTDFSAGINDSVYDSLIDSDGRIWLGGDYTTVGNDDGAGPFTRNRLAYWEPPVPPPPPGALKTLQVRRRVNRQALSRASSW